MPYPHDHRTTKGGGAKNHDRGPDQAHAHKMFAIIRAAEHSHGPIPLEQKFRNIGIVATQKYPFLSLDGALDPF
jgi:hypothetical protein